jgi:hypothetical protein
MKNDINIIIINTLELVKIVEMMKADYEFKNT